MADLNAKNYKAAYVDIPSNKIPPAEVSGGVMVAYDEYEQAGAAIALNDVIKLGIVIPKGARILEAVLKCPSMGTTGIFSLGTAADADSLLVNADAGGQAVKAVTTAAAVDLGKELAEETAYQLLVTEAADAAGGKKIQVWVTYSYL